MGISNSCLRHLSDVLLVFRGGSNERGHGETAAAAACEGEHGSSSSGGAVRGDISESSKRATWSGNVGSDVEKRIQSSKVHWSQLTEVESEVESDVESDVEDEEVAQDNRQVFEELMSHDEWGHFFKTFNYDTQVRDRDGELVVGEKFVEGGQAELFYAKVSWRNPKSNEEDLEDGREWVLKVFKKGTLLRDLQSQWPLGYLQFRGLLVNIVPTPTKFMCDVYCGTLLEDGRFAFLMTRENEDLHRRIDRVMVEIRDHNGPFPKEEVERIMFRIAKGMDWLHSHNIIHRDLKASNVLAETRIGCNPAFSIADFECSVGVVGTGFFRAPEILQALKDKVLYKDMKEFTKAADVYSYGMTCYEVLTGKLPFEGHLQNDYDLVLRGERPEIPEYVDSWIREVLNRCWEVDCSKRPLFPEILEILSNNSAAIRGVQFDLQEYDEEYDRKYQERLLQQGLVVELK